MARARKHQIYLSECQYYHCISRCVRRAFLCGRDEYTGKSYDHRKDWVEEKLCELVDAFAINLCAYAVMSNHFHVVLYVNVEQAKSWTVEEVLSRWHRLFKGSLLTQQYMDGEELGEAQLDTVFETAELYRIRLMDISWFMRIINEYIARQANKEDDCSGRFWEGRFTSQALLDEKAIAACMVYVDLNPIRAGIADTPENSMHTSIKKRLDAAKSGIQAEQLSPLVGVLHADHQPGLCFDVLEYITLVEQTGRCIRYDKPGYIQEHVPELLGRLDIAPDNWLKLTKGFRKLFRGPVGQVDCLAGFGYKNDLKRIHGINNSQKYIA